MTAPGCSSVSSVTTSACSMFTRNRLRGSGIHFPLDGADLAVVGSRLDERMHASNPPALRDRAGVSAFLSGLDLVDPGLVAVPDSRPDGEAPARDRRRHCSPRWPASRS
jgi:S-adenosyl methyltransferase